jgi:hypothetical protein
MNSPPFLASLRVAASAPINGRTQTARVCPLVSRNEPQTINRIQHITGFQRHGFSRGELKSRDMNFIFSAAPDFSFIAYLFLRIF